MILILNDVSGSEIILILAFILIFFGSKSIPGLAKTMGKTLRQIKDASQDIQNEIKKSGADMKKDLNLKGILEDTAEDVKRPLDQMATDLDQSIKYQPKMHNAHSQLQTVLDKQKVEVTPTQEGTSDTAAVKGEKTESKD